MKWLTGNVGFYGLAGILIFFGSNELGSRKNYCHYWMMNAIYYPVPLDKTGEGGA